MTLTIRKAEEGDASLGSSFFKELTEYEHFAHEVDATEVDVAEALKQLSEA